MNQKYRSSCAAVTADADVADDGDHYLDADTCNPQVQELESGHIWWYQEHMLQSVAEDQVPDHLRHPQPPSKQHSAHRLPV
jgi:hypothetical protein